MDVYAQNKDNSVFIDGDKRRWELENKRRCVNPLYKHRLRSEELYFTLSSYSLLPFKKSIFCIDFEKRTEITGAIETIVRSKFNYLEPLRNRSRCALDFARNISEFDDDSFVWFTVNHDHPFIKKPSLVCDILSSCSEDPILIGNDYIIPFSHWQETYYQIGFKSPNFMHIPGLKYTLIKERDNYLILHCNMLTVDTNFIAPAHFLKKIISRVDPRLKFRRLEDTNLYLKQEPLIVVLPKQELCRHIDSYAFKTDTDIPPLYIPDRFFSNNMKVQVGGPQRKKDIDVWVSDQVSSFAYEKLDGADFPGNFSDVPYFFKDHVEMKEKDFEKLYNSQLSIIHSPYSKRSTQPFDKQYTLKVLLKNICKYFYSKVRRLLLR